MLYAIGALVMLGAISLIPLSKRRGADKTTRTVAKVISIASFGAAAILLIAFLLH